MVDELSFATDVTEMKRRRAFAVFKKVAENSETRANFHTNFSPLLLYLFQFLFFSIVSSFN
jgi:hypothetical protein